MVDFKILAGGCTSKAVYHEDMTPETAATLKKHLLSLELKVIHMCWSDQAGWIPFGDLDLGIRHENGTCYPPPGEIVIYPGGKSGTEFFIGYGHVDFASKADQLPDNHFVTVVEGGGGLKAPGEKLLREGVRDIEFRSS